MLNRIENISPNSSYKEKPNPTIKTKEVYHAISGITDTIDSSNFSEAIKYWGVLKWKLKHFRQNSNDHVEIDFSIDDFNFHTTLSDLNNHTMPAEYEVTYKEPGNSNENRRNLNILIKFTPREIASDTNPTELFFLRSLFNRLLEYYIVNPEFEITPEIEQILFDQLKNGLFSELSDIHNKLIQFLGKVMNNYQNLSSYSVVHSKGKDYGNSEILEISLKGFL